MSTATPKRDLTKILAHIHSKVSYDIELGIVCGSGLAGLADEITDRIVIPYSEIPNFPHSEVPGHKNELVFGNLQGKKVVAMCGRFHFYEGWDVQDVVIGVRTMAALGARALIITNAAGGLDRSFKVGDLMLMTGHISMVGMSGKNPLIGPNDDSEGPRFPSISSVYDLEFGKVFEKAHLELEDEMKHDHVLRRGCYFGVAGPNYESCHEIQMMRIMGAQSVGMSTVLEVVQAAHSGLKVLGLSLITNNCIGTLPEEQNLPEPNHEEVTREAKKVSGFVQSVVARFVKNVDLSTRATSPLYTKYPRTKPSN